MLPLFLLVVALVTGQSAQAERVRGSFQAVVFQLNGANAVMLPDVLEGFISLGDTISGTFGYDTDRQATEASATHSWYRIVPGDFELLIGPKHLSRFPYDIGIDTNRPTGNRGPHLFTLSAEISRDAKGWPAEMDHVSILFALTDRTGTALQGTSLPSALTLSAFDSAKLVISGYREKAPQAPPFWRIDAAIVILSFEPDPASSKNP